MKVIKLSLVPDKDVPEFKRMAFTTTERPLREVLYYGLHPLGLTRAFDGYWDSSNLASVVADRLNLNEHVIPGLKEFGHAQEITASKRQYGYASVRVEDDEALDALKHFAEAVYFAEDLAYPGLVEVARRRLARHWTHETAREMLKQKFWAFNEQRRFLKEKSEKVTLKAKGDVDNFNLAEILTVDDFRNDDKLLVGHGIPGAVNFRRSTALQSFTTQDGIVALVPAIRSFEVRIAASGEKEVHALNSVHYRCRLLDGRIRLVPELNLGDDKGCRERARAIAGELARGGARFCFTLEIEEAEKLLPRAKLLFPELSYAKDEAGKEAVSDASIRADVALKNYAVGAVVTDRLCNKSMAKLLEQYQEKVSGTKDEMVERLVSVMVRLYSQSEKALARYFRRGFVKLGENSKMSPQVFEPPIDERGLRHSVVALYVLKHLRGSRILSPDWENTAYTVEDLARALVSRRVNVEGAFVRTA